MLSNRNVRWLTITASVGVLFLLIGFTIGRSIDAQSTTATQSPIAIGLPCRYTSVAVQTPEPTPTQQQRQEELSTDIQRYYNFYSCLYENNLSANYFIRVLIVIVAFASTVLANFADRPRIKMLSITFAALTTAVAAFQAAFPFGDRANFDLAILFRTERLLSDVRLAPATPDPDTVFSTFQQIKADAIANPVVTPVPSQATGGQPSR